MARGFSLVELMIAMTVLAIGLLGGIVVIAMATANNGQSQLHTTTAMMAQSTMEKIIAIPKTGTGAAAQTQITDCAGNTFVISTGIGGSVDFSQAPVPAYSMGYVMCSAGAGVTYDVRWRIEAGPTLSTQLVTVSAKSITGGQPGQLRFPFTLRQLRGNF